MHCRAAPFRSAWRSGRREKTSPSSATSVGGGWSKGRSPWREGRQRTGVALPADLDRSLRLLDDDQLDHLACAVAEEARRRGHDAAGESSASERKADKPGSAMPARAGSASSITPGQERMILAALEAGLKPAAIAREFRLARATVQKVIDEREATGDPSVRGRAVEPRDRKRLQQLHQGDDQAALGDQRTEHPFQKVGLR